LKSRGKNLIWNIYLLWVGSGSGKTTLAKKLATIRPEKYYRVLEETTRPIRAEEKQGVDYDFITQDELMKMRSNKELFEEVLYQFYPNQYGAKWSNLSTDKFNILVVSIEGFLSAARNLQPDDISILINILVDDELDVSREGRNVNQEENINRAVLSKFVSTNNYLIINNIITNYAEIKFSDLKEVRDNENRLIEFIENIDF